MIISASRYEDIPTFRGEFFLNILKAQKFLHKDPRGIEREIDLNINNVDGIVFWTKNVFPFIDKLKIIKDMGYNFYILNTYTNYKDFEINVNHKDALKGMIECSKLGYEIIWRYDPIIITKEKDYNWHIENFKEICLNLKGHVKKCYFSFINIYGKIKENLNKKNINIINDDFNNKKLIKILSNIALENNITMHTCANDKYISSNIYKGHCIDPDVIKTWLTDKKTLIEITPSRKECGCAKSYDIGTYNICLHGCIYCYANTSALTRIVNNI